MNERKVVFITRAFYSQFKDEEQKPRDKFILPYLHHIHYGVF